MYVDLVPNRSSPPAVLLRESYRQDGKVKKRTLANLSHWPADKIEALRRLLRDEPLMSAHDAVDIVRSLPHGHVAAALGMASKLGLPKLIARNRSGKRDLVMAMVAGRLLSPSSKLALTRSWSDSTLAEQLGVQEADEDELYEAMDWALRQQPRVQQRLAARHLTEGGVVLYDLTSSYFEGRSCPLAAFGNNRDRKRGKLQVNWGLVTNAEGCPVAVQVYEGKTGDPDTLEDQLKKLKERFGIERVVMVGDRGMITQARIEQIKKCQGIDWITALRAPAIQKLRRAGSLQLTLFDQKDMAEISDPAYPGERLVVCRNPRLADERTRKREALLAATEAKLDKVVSMVERGRLKGADMIGVRVGKVINDHKVAKHFELKIEDNHFSYRRRHRKIAEEAALDGIYVLRTSVQEERLPADEVVRTYKRLAKIERAFRSIKTMDLQVRPIHHRLEDRVRSHIFLCMLAYYLLWHLQRAWRPLLFADEVDAPSTHISPVAPAKRSKAAERKASTKRTQEGFEAHSFQTLLVHLSTLARNTVQLRDQPDTPPFPMLTQMTPLQQRAFELIDVKP